MCERDEATPLMGVWESVVAPACLQRAATGDSAPAILNTVLARLAFFAVQLLCCLYNCFDCLHLPDWFRPRLVNLSFLVYSILFLGQFVVLPPGFSTVISPQVFPPPCSLHWTVTPPPPSLPISPFSICFHSLADFCCDLCQPPLTCSEPLSFSIQVPLNWTGSRGCVPCLPLSTIMEINNTPRCLISIDLPVTYWGILLNLY